MISLATIFVYACITDPSVNRPGVCPPVDEGEAMVGVCANLCSVDTECNGLQRCCPTFCGGTSCMDTVLIEPPGRVFKTNMLNI